LSATPSSDALQRNPVPPAQFVGSPNYNRRPQGEISAIVIHATANSTLQGVIAWFNNPQAQASAHYTIDKDGTLVQHVQDSNRAWHAGVSSWQGRENLNDWSIGIELVNLNNGQDPFPESQHQANLNLVAHLASKYNVRPEFILAHYDVSPGRKTDPKGYDMDRLRWEVAARL
jgi:N-acetyl-anhydromuramyl-L-alanine amidase AmpD